MSKPGRPSLTRRAALLLGLLLAARSFPTARLEPLTPRDAAAAAEFPPYDNPVFAEAAASSALAEAPDTVDTLALVLSQDRIDDALAVLKRIVERHPVYQRKALATLACLAFEQRDYKTALDRFTLYVRLYPDSAYAWVAALRSGESYESMAEWPAAAASYRAASARYSTVRIAQVLGHEYAARALEASN